MKVLKSWWTHKAFDLKKNAVEKIVAVVVVVLAGSVVVVVVVVCNGLCDVVVVLSVVDKIGGQKSVVVEEVELS